MFHEVLFDLMTSDVTLKNNSSTSLQKWFKTPAGQVYQHAEAVLLSAVLRDNFRSSVLQVGQIGWEEHVHKAMRFAHYTILDAQPKAAEKCSHVIGLAGEMPIDSHSLDIVILPHALDFDKDPHQVLREVNRVLKPEGIIMLIGFNPWAFWHLPRFFPNAKKRMPWCGEFISRYRVIDWLKLLNFDIEKKHGFCFFPIGKGAKQETNSKILKFLNRLGRYLPFLPAAYFVMGVKRVSGSTSVFNLWDLKNRLVPPLRETASNRVNVKKTSANTHGRRVSR